MQRAPLQFNYQESLAQQRRWVRLRFETLFMMWALMEIALIAPLVLLLVSSRGRLSTTQITLGVTFYTLCPFYLARVLTWARMPRKRQRYVLIFTAVFFFLLSLYYLEHETRHLWDIRWIGAVLSKFAAANNAWQQPFTLFFIMLLCWWRGLSLVSHYVVTSRAFGFRLRQNSLVYLPIVVLLAALGSEWRIVPFIALYFVASPIAMILTRVEEAEREYGAILRSMTPRWLIKVAGSSFLLALLATGTAVFVSGRWKTITTTFAAVWVGFKLSVASTLLTMAYLVSPYLEGFEAFLHTLFRLLQAGIELLFDPAPPPKTHDFQATPNEWLIEQLTRPVQETIFTNLNWRIIFLVAFSLIFIVVLLLLALYYRKDKTVYGYGRLSRLISELTATLASPSFTHKKRKTKSDWRDWKTAVSIIKIYENMLHAANELGYSRNKTETPYEYLATLKIVWPEHQQQTHIITQAYVNIKYGQFPESKEELREIQNSWRIIKNSKSVNLDKEKN